MNTLLKKTPNKTDKAKSASALLPKQLHIDGVTYEWIKVLGRGGYAVAVSAKRVDVDGDGKDKQPSVVAIKTLHKANLEASKVQMLVFFAKREVSILKALNHPNIIKLYSHWSDESYIYMIMELCPNNNLSHLIKSETTILESTQIRQFFYEMTLGCQHIHSRLVVHRDLKPDNVLLTEQYRIKIADFGLSVALKCPTEMLRRFCGTLKYQAPEMVQRKEHSFPIDVWALGCILYRLYYVSAPFDGPTKEDIFMAILGKSPKYAPENSKSGEPLRQVEIALMKKMLVKDPAQRIKVAELLLYNRKYFEGNAGDEEEVERNPLTGVGKIIASLEAISTFDARKRIRLLVPYTELHSAEQMPKYWVTEFIDSPTEGFGYLCNKNIFGFNFYFDQRKLMLVNDQVVLMHDGQKASPLRRFSVKSPPAELTKPVKMLKQYHNMLKEQIEKEQMAYPKTEMIDSLAEDLPWLDKMITIKGDVSKCPVAIAFLFTNELIQLTFLSNGNIFLFDGHQNAFSIINEKDRLLTLDLQFLLEGHITDEMQCYATESLKYIRFFLDSFE